MLQAYEHKQQRFIRGSQAAHRDAGDEDQGTQGDSAPFGLMKRFMETMRSNGQQPMV